MSWLLVWPGRMVVCLHWTSRWQTWQTSLRQSRLNFPRLPWTEYFPGHIRACQNIAKHNGMPYCLIAFDLRAWQVGYSLLLFTCYELESLFSNFVFFYWTFLDTQSNKLTFPNIVVIQSKIMFKRKQYLGGFIVMIGFMIYLWLDHKSVSNFLSISRKLCWPLLSYLQKLCCWHLISH